jgi:hypothetical protein
MTSMPRWLKLTLKIAGMLVGILFVLWMLVAAYVYSNKETLLKTVTAQLNENLNGRLTIERMEPSLIRGFPGISVSLQNVLLRDSLWEKHRHDLLNASDVFIAIDAFSILSGSPTIKDIRIDKGAIYLFTDSTGVRNTDIFKKRDKTAKEGSGGSKRINRVVLNEVLLTVDDRLKNKLFRFNIDDFTGRIRYGAEGWKGQVRMLTKVESFAFNIKRGSFIKDKVLRMNLDMSYEEKDHLLRIPLQKIGIGEDDFRIAGQFKFAPAASDYQLDIQAPSILYSDALPLLPPHLEKKLSNYGIKKPLQVQASLKGKLKRGGEPLIRVSWKVDKNELVVGGEEISGVSFTGFFHNQWNREKARNDHNSVIRFSQMKGNYQDIPFVADSIMISDLREPVFTGNFRSSFPLTKLNRLLGTNTFVFNKGKADLSLIYKAPFDQNDKGERFIYGTIKTGGARATYKPRNLSLEDMQMVMNFQGRDLSITNLKLTSGSSSLAMDGRIENFSNLYYSDPAKMLVHWQIRSPQINLNEFMAFAGRRKGAAPSPAKVRRGVQRISNNLEQMLEQASMRMNLSLGRVIYKKFVATDVRGAITLQQSGILINNLGLKQGGGSVNLTGSLDQSGIRNQFTIDSRINNVNVERLFYAFDNFGQDAITSQNLRGTFFGGTSVSGTMDNQGGIVPRSFRGTVRFDIRNGALVNFEPMTKVGNFAFPNRNFSDIRFTNLKNTLTLRGEKVIIPPMEIRSTVLNIFLDGVYSFSTGTNIAIKVPLRNPSKDEAIADSELKKARDLKGIVINLRALDGENGKVRFRLGKRAPADYGNQ